MTEKMVSSEELLHQFVSSGKRFRDLAESLSESELDISLAPGSWTIRQNIHHIGDDGDVWSMCIKKAIAVPGSLVRFEGFPGNEQWAAALHFERREVETSLALLVAHRNYITGILTHFPSAWDRSVRFADGEGNISGEMTVREMVKMLANHTDEHAAEIEKVLKVANI